MWKRLQQIWNTKDLRSKILFVAAMMVVFRFTAHIPVPGVDAAALQNLFAQNQLLGLFSLFSGGALENFSIAMLGVGPYITSSIIFQVLQMVVPQLEELAKEGASGQKKISQYTRYASVPLAAIQGFATINLLQSASGGGILDPNMSVIDWVVMVTVITAGSVFLMWLGELISEKNIGNGVSLLIFAGIIAALPSTLQSVFVSFDSSQLPSLLAFGAIAVITILGVVFITEGQRNIPISHARHHSAQGQQSYLPIRVNQAGVIPIIFAISLVLAPPLLAQSLLQFNLGFLNGFLNWVIEVFNNQFWYAVIYFVLVVMFSYFYTSVVFKPDRIAENLQRGGSFIPGVRPGTETVEYLQRTSNRILFTGSFFLGFIAILPLIIQAFSSGNLQNLAIGGTSLLIIVSVALETVKQIEAQLLLRDLDAY